MARKQIRTYERYARAESARKALVYQKKYLMLCIDGFKETEEATIKLITERTVLPVIADVAKIPKTRFRAAVRAVIAINRYATVCMT